MISREIIFQLMHRPPVRFFNTLMHKADPYVPHWSHNVRNEFVGFLESFLVQKQETGQKSGQKRQLKKSW